jgi:hypothetical protein
MAILARENKSGSHTFTNPQKPQAKKKLKSIPDFLMKPKKLS